MKDTTTSTKSSGPKVRAGTDAAAASGTASTKRKRRDGAQPDFDQMVRVEAWLRAERRGFSPGGELDDWLQAERDVRQKFDSGSAA